MPTACSFRYPTLGFTVLTLTLDGISSPYSRANRHLNHGCRASQWPLTSTWLGSLLGCVVYRSRLGLAGFWLRLGPALGGVAMRMGGVRWWVGCWAGFLFSFSVFTRRVHKNDEDVLTPAFFMSSRPAPLFV